MKLKRVRPLVATVALLMGAALLAPPAFGSPGFGFTATNLVTANLDEKVKTNHDGVKLQTKGPTDVRVTKFVAQPGASFGWHHHPGVVIIAIETGTVTFTDSECHATTYGPGLPTGSALIETGDQPGLVTSATGATTYTTFIAPSADPPVFRIEDNPPPCAG